MMNVQFFEDQASNTSQKEFNEDWLDVIEEVADHSTALITEDYNIMVIKWDDEGKYVKYLVHALPYSE